VSGNDRGNWFTGPQQANRWGRVPSEGRVSGGAPMSGTGAERAQRKRQQQRARSGL